MNESVIAQRIQLYELRNSNRITLNAWLAKNPVQMDWSHGEDEVISIGRDYTEVFPNLLGKDIDTERIESDSTLWLMEAKDDVRINEHSHPNIEMYFVLRGEISELIKGVVTKSEEKNRIGRDQLHDILIKAGTFFLIKWSPALLIN